MKKLSLLFALCPLLIWGNDTNIPSKIKGVTVFLSGAQVTREAMTHLNEGTTELAFGGLSHKIEESSIQLSGLQSVSILSLSYDIVYSSHAKGDPQILEWEMSLETLQNEVALLKNVISGLEEEEKVITTNRLVSTDSQALDLAKIKEISRYYRERITAIKNEVFKTNLKIKTLNAEMRVLKKQLTEANNAPEEAEGKITIKFDAPTGTSLRLLFTYLVKNAGWIPAYDIKSGKINDPLDLAYKAHVYQKTGKDWEDVNLTLSAAHPNINIARPNLGSRYLNFVSRYADRPRSDALKKYKYVYNPTVKQVTGIVTDDSGTPLPGCSVVVQGTDKGTQTDFDGYYSLAVSGGRDLAFSYLGFKPEQMPIYSSIVNVTLEEDAAALDEVVVTAYSSTAAVSASRPENMLQGQAAGIHIRGNSGFEPPQRPLYIIDGVTAVDFVEGDLDEDEIESIEVLKGANAISLYGSKGSQGVIVITTKKNRLEADLTNTRFNIEKPYSITSDGDITAIEINKFQLEADYEYYAAPIVNENVFLTATFTNWEKYNLLPGEANIYFEGAYAGKTTIDPYTVKREMLLSLGTDPNITVTRRQERNFKRKSFTGSNRILDRTYGLYVRNNKGIDIALKLVDRVPLSQNKEIKVDDIVTKSADYDEKKGLLTWIMNLAPGERRSESFSFQVKFPRYKTISL